MNRRRRHCHLILPESQGGMSFYFLGILGLVACGLHDLKWRIWEERVVLL
jgi:hypothetical protein